ncbi:MAG: (2Fe-2S)-binding protein [Acidobacteria bacterium]|nr:(2Fe-2S)-binding protein [Acidobacteriota bacterium]
MSGSKFVVIDGNEVEFREGETILHAARRLGIEIPTLCHDDRLEPAGACRICLVEVEGSRLMQPACAFRTAPGMVVRTNTTRVDRNRQFIISLHLADTVADRDEAEDVSRSKLHDYAAQYGISEGDWPHVESPREGRADDENPFIAFRPDRCIVCAACVRYCDEVEGVSAITLANRGGRTTIATADLRSLDHTTCEMCGGCIAVCPTGAMTEKPALFYGKPERELERVRSTCNFCGVGCQIDINVDREANRIVKVTSPPPGTTVNDGNLCVKGRFANDFVHHPDRLTVPLVREVDGQLREASWDEALDRAVRGLQSVRETHGSDSLAFISSSRCTGEENYLIQKLARAGFGTQNIHQCAAT